MEEQEKQPIGYKYSVDLLQGRILQLQSDLTATDNRFLRYRRQQLLGIETKYTEAEMIEKETIREGWSNEINAIEALLQDEERMNELHAEQGDWMVAVYFVEPNEQL